MCVHTCVCASVCDKHPSLPPRAAKCQLVIVISQAQEYLAKQEGIVDTPVPGSSSSSSSRGGGGELLQPRLRLHMPHGIGLPYFKGTGIRPCPQ